MARKLAGKRSFDADGTMHVHGKASNGEGSLYRDSDGAWRATFIVPGEARPRRVRGRTRDEAIARRAAKLAALGQSQYSRLDPETTVAELAGWWLDVVARHRVRKSSFGKYEGRVKRIADTFGATAVRNVTRERVATWQSDLMKSGLAATTVSDVRGTLRQVLEQAVINELIASNPVDRVAAPKVVRSPKRALSSGDARRLVEAASTDRLGAAVALLFVHGWRVSEVLGLAWEDLDLDAGTATVRRAAVYVDGVGVTLGPTKTASSTGLHHLSPGVVAALRLRRKAQAAERVRSEAWQSHRYEGRPVSLVFTNHEGGLVNRQAVSKAVVRAAERAGLDASGLATHTGRRTTVTVLYAEAGLDLSDIARYVGHAGEATTAGYVRHLGERPKNTAAKAAAILDPATNQRTAR